jgi:two-component system sensor histidine kinase SenX3
MEPNLRRRLELSLARLDPQRAAALRDATVEEVLDAIEAAVDQAGAATERSEVYAAGLGQVVDFAGNGVVICNAAGDPIYRNSRAAALVGAQGGDLIADQAIDEMLVRAVAGHAGERNLELFSPYRRTLCVRAQPLRASASGKVTGAVAVIDDVSERRRLDSIRRDFVANVSHELKTPVGALSLLAETLDGEEDPDTVARLSARVASEVGRLGRIIDDLLDLSRIEANESGALEEVAVRGLVAEAVEPLRGAARSRDIELRIMDIPPALSLFGNRRDAISAIANLIDNAIKYSDTGSPVTVCALQVGGHVEIRVTDEGLGIPARDVERIFERFYRVDRARSRATGGTGLGLSIVRHVAVNHGGTVEVSSVEGQGSTFTLRLPVLANRGATTDNGSAPAADHLHALPGGPAHAP